MDNKKFETLIDLIINENEEQARDLFHEIVVEKSREIYESIMDEEMMDEGMGGQVGDLMDEIAAEESGDVVENEEVEDEESEEIFDLDDEDKDEEDHHADVGGNEELEDRVVDLEDKIDELMAEFEAIMKDGSSEEVDAEVDIDADIDEALSEAVQLQKVSVTHGDDGANKKSVVAANAGAKGMDSKPVKFSGDNEAVPTSPKGPSNEYSKKEGELPGAGKFKNVPGGKAKVDLSAAPKPVTKDGSSNDRSPVAKG